MTRPAKTPAKHRPGPQAIYGEKGWRLVRLWHTLMIIAEAEKPLTAAEINERLAVDGELRQFEGKLATTRDDLWTLVRCGFPIKLLDETGEEIDLSEYLNSETGRRGKLKKTRWAMKAGNEIGIIRGVHHRLPSSAELTTLSLLRAMLQDNVPIDYPLFRQLQVLLDQLYLWLVARFRAADRTEMIERLMRTGRKYLRRGPGAKVLIALGEALQRERMVDCVYTMPDGNDVPMQIFPIAAWFVHGRGHLLGARGKDSALRSYRIDRFVSMSVNTTVKVPRVDKDAAKQLLAGSFGGFVGKPENIEVKFHPDIAYLFDDFEFHPSQVVRKAKQKDAWISVTLKCAVSYALEEWVLGFGEKAEVIAPSPLRERIISRLLDAAARYGSASPPNQP